MKRWIISLILFVLSGLIIGILFWPKVDMKFATNGVAIFKYDNHNISELISADDFSSICDLFNGKKLYSDNLSCGFSNDVSICINETESFCFAHDSCPVVYWKNKNKFFRLSQSEYDILTDILNKYGFIFPCL